MTFTFALVANAQIRAGGFMSYAERINLFGLGAHVEVFVTDRIGVSPSFVYFFPRKINDDIQTRMWEWNANGHYYLIDARAVNLYALAGLNYSTTRNHIDDLLSDRVENDYNAGLNLGAGLLVRVNQLLPFVEAKFTAGSYSQFVFFAGVKYEFGSRFQDVD
jgi:hypothetical protein